MEFDNLSPRECFVHLENQRRKLKEAIIKSNEAKNKIEFETLFRVGDQVMMKCFPIKRTGIDKPRFEGPGVVKIIDPKSYCIELNGKIFRRHESSIKMYRVLS